MRGELGLLRKGTRVTCDTRVGGGEVRGYLGGRWANVEQKTAKTNFV